MAQDDVGIESIMALIGNSAMLINGGMTAVIKLMEAVWKVTKAATIPGIGIAKTTFRNWKDDRELKKGLVSWLNLCKKLRVNLNL